jgi:hypothetical protein
MFEQNPRGSKVNKILKFFSLVMTLAYPALGIYLLISTQEQIRLDSTIKNILGGVLIVYGIFRFYRAYQQYFRQQD